MAAHSRTRTALAIVAAVFAALILVQVFLAGLGVLVIVKGFLAGEGEFHPAGGERRDRALVVARRFGGFRERRLVQPRDAVR